MKTTLSTFLALALALPIAAEEAPPSAALSLAEAFQAALPRAERLGQAQAAMAKAEAQIDEAFGSWLPQIQLKARENLAEGGAGLQSPSLALNVREDLIKGLDQVASHKARGPLRAKASADLAKARQDLARELGTAYIDVLDLEDQAEIARNAKANAEAASQELRRRVALGRNRRSELSSAEAQSARASAGLAAIDGRVWEARLALASLTGLSASAQLQALPAPEEALAASAPSGSPAEASAAEALKLAQARLIAARGGYGPNLFAEANAYAARQGGASGPAWDAQVGVDLPLFRFGAQRARVRQAEADLRVAELEAGRVKREAGRELEQAFSALAHAQARLLAAEQSLAASEKSYSDQKRDFNDSLISSLDLTRAQDAVVSARLDASSARWGLQRAALRLRLAIGRTEP